MTSTNTPTTNNTTPTRQHALSAAAATSPPSKRDLRSWWKGFKLAPRQHQESQEAQAKGIFGIPLRQSITYANVAISLIDEQGESYIYGYVPIVVAKCGVFLKEKATGIEGIFRLSGSEKRIKELKQIFNSPDRYGKGLSWDGYTVHDAANVLRRYLNGLPEPVVPLDLYEKFRDPLRGATRQAVGDMEGPQFVEDFDEKAAINKYQQLITELPPLNKQLLLYILDLLAVFAAKSDENRMNSQNLAAIFQPGMLSHPSHALAPEEYRLNQCVIIFLIENQDHFLIGMEGTEADEKMQKEVESGIPVVTPVAPATPNANLSPPIGRSSSNASAGADSVRRDGKVRRNRSITSKHSKHEGNSTPSSPALATTPTTTGLGRSNTVPSKRSPALIGGKFHNHDGTGQSRTTTKIEPLTKTHPIEEQEQEQGQRISETKASAHPPGSVSIADRDQHLDIPAQEVHTPTKERTLPNLFSKSPTETVEKRQPNKLKKKRLPGSLSPSAQSSNVSLGQAQSNVPSPMIESSNPMDPTTHAERETRIAQSGAASNPILEAKPTAGQFVTEMDSGKSTHEAETAPPVVLSQDIATEVDTAAVGRRSLQTGHTDKESEERQQVPPRNEGDVKSTGSPPQAQAPPPTISSTDNALSSSTGSGDTSSKPRKSFTESTEYTMGGSEPRGSQDVGRERRHSRDTKDSKEESRGPMHWIKHKYREARNKSPTGEKVGHGHGGGFLSHRPSMDKQHEEKEKDKMSEKDKEKVNEKFNEKDKDSPAPVQNIAQPATLVTAVPTTQAAAQPQDTILTEKTTIPEEREPAAAT